MYKFAIGFTVVLGLTGIAQAAPDVLPAWKPLALLSLSGPDLLAAKGWAPEVLTNHLHYNHNTGINYNGTVTTTRL